MDSITLLIIDGHPLVREALRLLLQAEPNLEVIGDAGDGLTGVRLFDQLRPDVVVMDLFLPGLDGLGAIRQMLATNPQAKILVFSSLDDEAYPLAAARSGAGGYLSKSVPRPILVEAIRRLANDLPATNAPALL